MREVDFEEGTCDLAILGQICHSEGAEHSQDLFRKLHRALRPGGKLLIADMVPDEGRSSAAFPLFFALNMLVHTAQGDTFTLSEYTKWLTDAGFRSVSTLEAPGPSPLIVAER
jgi:SAM-dependent methyltransferase